MVEEEAAVGGGESLLGGRVGVGELEVGAGDEGRLRVDDEAGEGRVRRLGYEGQRAEEEAEGREAVQDNYAATGGL